MRAVMILAILAVPAAALAQVGGITPPEVVSRVDAELPAGVLAPGEMASVRLVITIDDHGTVTDVTVPTPGRPELDAAAVAAVKQWKFRPALRGGMPIPTRIGAEISFAAPAPTPTSQPATEPATEPASQPATEPATEPASEPATEPAGDQTLDATVRGRARARSRGNSDYTHKVDKLAAVPRKSAPDYLKLAPGFLLTNEGGEGHAEQIFLRGFDAREGQDIEVSVDGVVVNEAGNLHGNGYTDLHFVLPELIDTVRVIEGPFDPRQGNFGVSGSAEYELALAQRGLVGKLSYGSFNTRRLALLWGPPGKGSHTFGAVELYQTDGFGQNRDARRGTAWGQIEGRVGDEGSFRLSLSAYTTSYHTAGVLREDDYQNGAKGFYDTYDFHQGGDATRVGVNFDYQAKSGDVTHEHQIWFTAQSMRLRENFTGFLLDVQQPIQSPHPQRGDLIDLFDDGLTFGARGWARKHGPLFGHDQELELGYFARVDKVHGTQYRIQDSTQVPYHVDTDLDSLLGDVGLYGDANLKLTGWLTLRGGARADLFTYDVLDNCAAQSVHHPSPVHPPGDDSCLDQQDFGRHREPVQRSSATGAAFMPRGTLLVGPFHDVTLSASYGLGVRSIDPVYVTQDIKTPFASITAYELGAGWQKKLPSIEASARAVLFRTHVDKDLIFSETEGRNIIGGGSTRSGAALSGRATGSFFDVAGSVTFVQSSFDDTGLLIPYVPDTVARLDSALFGPIMKLAGTIGLGVTYVGRRALPYGERSDPIFTVDASASLAWRSYSFGVTAQNLLDTQYRLGEYNYVSIYTPGLPTLVPSRHFTAGAPLTLLFTLEVGL